jgi:hypothetical protein
VGPILKSSNLTNNKNNKTTFLKKMNHSP